MTAAREAIDKVPDDTALSAGFAQNIFWQLIYEGRAQDALEYVEALPAEAVGMGSFYRPRSQMMAIAFEQLGDADSARQAFEEAAAKIEGELERQPDHEKLLSALGVTYAALGRSEEAIELGRRAAEIVPLSKDPYFGQIHIQDLAWIYVRTGQYDLAFDQLEILLAMPSWITIPYLKLDPRWAPLWDQPRFQTLEEKYG